MSRSLKIRRIIVNFGDKQYTLDVDEGISFHYLKKMITTAANIGNNRIKLFHKNQDVTKNEQETLESEYPNENPINFRVTSEEKTDNFDRLLKVRLNQVYCPLHDGKYLTFYCYDCKKSICSGCILSGLHNNHVVKEKQDYLQSSKVVIGRIFEPLKLNYPTGEEEFAEIRAALKSNTEGLIALIRAIEDVLNNVIDNYELEHSQINEIIENNYEKLKVACIEGFDKLKSKVDIEDMMLNEDIFLIVDQKLKFIEELRAKFLNYVNSRSDFFDGLQKLRALIDSSSDPFGYLEGFKEKVSIGSIVEPFNQIDKDGIIRQIIGGVQEQDPALLRSSYKKKNYDYKYPKDITPKTIVYEEEINVLPPRLITRENAEVQGEIITNLSQKKVTARVVASTKEEVEEINLSNARAFRWSSGLSLETGNRTRTIVKKAPSSNKIIQTPSKGGKDIKYSTNRRTHSSKKKGYVYGEMAQYLCQPIIGTKDINVFDVTTKTTTKKTMNANIKFDGFLEECSWVNYNDFLYIAGGKQGDKGSKDFYKYDPNTDKISILSPLPEGRYGHSICIDEDNDCLYIIGGNSKNILKFDLNQSKWIKMNIKLNEIKYHPNVFIDGEILYVVFGMDEKNKMSANIDKININAKGDMTTYAKNEKFKRIHSGVIITPEGNALLVGGKDPKNVTLETAIEINLETGNCLSVANKLVEPAYFMQSILALVGDFEFGNFTLNESNPFILFKLSLNE